MTVTHDAPPEHSTAAEAVGGEETTAFVVPLPPGLADEIRAEVSDEAVSDYVTTAAVRQLRDERAARFVQDYEAEHGPFSPEVIAEAEVIWQDAQERYEAWLAANNEK